MFDIEELFNEIDKNNKPINEISNDENKTLESFLENIELYIGDYAKDRAIKSGNEILALCSEYEDYLNNEDIFLYYKAYGKFLTLDIQESIYYIEKAIEINKNAYEYYQLRADCYEELNDNKEAINNYLLSYELNKKNFKTLKGLAFVLLQEGDITESLTYFEKALEIEDTDHNLIAGISSCYLLRADFNKALEYITRAIELDEKEVSYRLNRAVIYNLLMQTDKAIEECKKIIEINPSFYIAHYTLVDFLLQEARIDEAEKILKDIIELKTKHSMAYVKLAQCNLMKDECEKALEYINKAIEMEPINVEYYQKRAVIYRALNDFESAEKDYLDILEIDSNNWFIYCLIGNFYMEYKKYEKALIYLEKALSLNKDNSEIISDIEICKENIN